VLKLFPDDETNLVAPMLPEKASREPNWYIAKSIVPIDVHRNATRFIVALNGTS
jgi:hypothetical protein